jgi:hypothetical protein
MLLFNAKILPILTYSINIVWCKLSTSDLNAIEKVKARFLKAALGLSKFTPSRLVYELARETFLTKDNRLRYLLAPTKASTKLLEQRKQKREHIYHQIYTMYHKYTINENK